ncbi:hypothetical protein [Alicyclobacillus fodiniaquatilis]|uniref:Uncharacterized protein n=1 Tax=Alicyclobacillus fodiniaquatilis TaxID=1661150 RepID=A0ABW4JPF3_9BACL
MNGETKTPQERIQSLEDRFSSLEVGMDRVEQALTKMGEQFEDLKEKLDARYPTQESVNLRFDALWKDVIDMKEEHQTVRKDVERLKGGFYRFVGGAAVAGALIGYGLEVLHMWKG